jgi:diaminopimelate decarboxylase
MRLVTGICNNLQIASVVNEALDEYFPASCGVEIIAEPGRYFVASAFTLTVNIIAKRVVTKEETNGKICEIGRGQQMTYDTILV